MNLSFLCINSTKVGRLHPILVIFVLSSKCARTSDRWHHKMAVQKQSATSFALITSVLSIVFYCVGFIRLELELHEQKSRISALERVAEPTTPPSDHPDTKLIKRAPGKFMST